MSQLHGDEEVEEEVVEVEDVKVVEVVEEEPVEEVVEVEALMTINDVGDRFMGIVNSARAAGIAAVTSRGFAALE